MSGEQKEGAETPRSRKDNEKIKKKRGKLSDETRDGPANGLSREK